MYAGMKRSIKAAQRIGYSSSDQPFMVELEEVVV